VIPATAQAGIFTLEQLVETRDDGDALLLDIYFNLVDSNNRPLSEVEVEDGRITLDTGEQYNDDQVSVGKSSAPYFIVLVLDASGSMSSANPALRQAAIAAIERAPSGAQFAVLSFDELVRDVQGFSADLDETQRNIDGVRSVENGGTCLYDAAYRALDLLIRQSQGRRAVILFSDGVDERSDGVQPCSVRSADDTIAYAQANRVPLHVIGMTGADGTAEQIDSALLSRFAVSTGGLFSSGSESQLGTLFERAMIVLSGQWLAQVRLFPRAGQHSATLIPILRDGVQAQPITVQFTSPRDYELPFQLFAGAPRYDVTSGTISLDVTTTGGGRAASLIAQVLDERNLAVYQPDTPIALSAATDSVPLTLTIPATAIAANGRYRVLLNAAASNSGVLLPEDIEVEFTIDRTQPTVVAVQVRLSIVNVRLLPDTVEIGFDVIGAERIAAMRLILIDEFGAAVGAPITTTAAQRTASFPRAGLPPGAEYTVELTAYASDGRPLIDQPARRGFANGAPPEPPRLIMAISHTPGVAGVTVDLDSSNITAIDSLDVAVFNADTNTRIGTPFRLDRVPASFILPPELIARLGAGDYIVTLSPRDIDGALLLDVPLESDPFLYAPPTPGFIQVVGSIVTNPIVLSVIVAGILFLSVTLYQRTRRARRSTRAPGYRYRDDKSVIKDIGRTRDTDDLTVIDRADDYGRAAQNPTALYSAPARKLDDDDTLHDRPLAELVVMRAESFTQGKRFTLTRTGATLGRGAGTINFDRDEDVSSKHLVLQYDQQRRVFTASDVGREGRGTVNGTKIDSKLIKNNIVELPGDRQTIIRMGSVKLAFRMYPAQR